MSRDRKYVVHLTTGETVEPDICKTNDNGWLYCCWQYPDESVHRKYPPHAVEHYASLPADTEEVEA